MVKQDFFYVLLKCSRMATPQMNNNESRGNLLEAHWKDADTSFLPHQQDVARKNCCVWGALLSITREHVEKEPFHFIWAYDNPIERLPPEPKVQEKPSLKGGLQRMARVDHQNRSTFNWRKRKQAPKGHFYWKVRRLWWMVEKRDARTNTVARFSCSMSA